MLYSTVFVLNLGGIDNMCGIVGYVGPKDVVSVLLVGLERLSYRGYDSSGIATIYQGELSIRKEVGKLRSLSESIQGRSIKGDIGLGHTRWATHGVPSEENSHPLVDCTKSIAVVHNGIIENYHELRNRLENEGHIFSSETDTEVIVHLIEKYFEGDLEKAVRMAIEDAQGSYAIAAISEKEPDKIVTARYGSPLIIGLGEGENFLASDVTAVINHTRDVIYMDDGEIAVITKKGVKITDNTGNEIKKNIHKIEWDAEKTEKNGYGYFMEKEIYEQPAILRNVISKRIDANNEIHFEDAGIKKHKLVRINRFVIQACGTSWHSGLIGKYWLEKYSHIHTEVDVSSEFRYRGPVMENRTLVMAITQSGETADTLAGIREAKSKFHKVLSICNVEGSTMARESDMVIYTLAGPEIGVASTKAFTAQLAALYLFSLLVGDVKYIVSKEELKEKLNELKQIPTKIEKILRQNNLIKDIALKYANSKDFLFIGRGENYPAALEGALKLKEISYIHATGYPAGELKHGPIALIDKNMPVVCLIPKDSRHDKMVSNIQEVKSRQGKVIAIATEGDEKIKNIADDVIYLPPTSEDLTPLLTVVPLQLLAFYIALERKCDVDQPRNLAKSVTVE